MLLHFYGKSKVQSSLQIAPSLIKKADSSYCHELVVQSEGHRIVFRLITCRLSAQHITRMNEMESHHQHHVLSDQPALGHQQHYVGNPWKAGAIFTTVPSIRVSRVSVTLTVMVRVNRVSVMVSVRDSVKKVPLWIWHPLFKDCFRLHLPFVSSHYTKTGKEHKTVEYSKTQLLFWYT